jgi:hypothetical protein
MSFRSDVDRAREKIKEILGETTKDHDAEINEVLYDLWKDAIDYSPSWDGD